MALGKSTAKKGFDDNFSWKNITRKLKCANRDKKDITFSTVAVPV